MKPNSLYETMLPMFLKVLYIQKAKKIILGKDLLSQRVRDDLTFMFVVSPQWDCLGQGTQIIKLKLPIWPCERAGGVTRNTMGVWVLEALGEPPVTHWWWQSA